MRSYIFAFAALLAPACGGAEFIADEEAQEEVTVAAGPLSWRDIDVELVESRHPYANNTNDTWTIAGPDCARQLRITFEYIATERGYDFVTVSRGNGRQVASYTGNRGSFTRTVPGNSATIRLTSDESITGRGFRVSRVEAHTPCGEGFHCGVENGAEVCISDHNRCELVRCAPGFECVNEGPDACIPSCNGFECGDGQTCVMEQIQCIRAPCYAHPTCVPTLDCASVLCIEGTQCQMIDGRPECVPNVDACATVRCSADTHCEVNEDGSAGCVPNINPCARVRCASGTQCQVIDGGAQCIPVLTCASVLCAVGTTCEDLPSGAVCTERPFQVENTDFGSGNPYRNNERRSWSVISDVPNAVQVRLHFSRFDLEDGYDFVIITHANGTELARYTGNRGEFTTDAFDTGEIRVLFTSDASVTRSGFRVDRIESR